MKTSNKLLKLVTFLSISLLVLGILACTNIVEHKEENSYIRISATIKNMRTVLPTAFTENTKGLNWFLTGVCGDSSIEKNWTDTNDKTAYENMTSETFIIPKVGDWNFTLIAQIDGKNVLSCQLNQEIFVGQNTLRFDMFEATGDNIANGQIDFTLKFSKDIVSKSVAYLYNQNDVNIIIHTEELTVNTSDMSLNYKNESLSSGYYILKINLYQNVNNTDSLINTYTCLVRVAPGLCSKGEYQLEKLAQIFTINYNTNGGTFSDPIIPTTYNTYTKFQLPTPTKVGYDFTGWYTDADCSIEVILDDSNAYNLTANVDLYAGWKAKGSQDNPIKNWEDLVAVMTEDGGDIYISGNMTANKTLTVTKVSKLIANNVTISRGDSFYGNFFNVSSDGSLEIAGSENSTITLDGGNSDSNPITVQSPLITVNGELTLSNCTLQNNNNSNYGGAVYVDGGTLNFSSGTIQNCKATDGGAVYITSRGTFNMNGGTITRCSATNSGGGVWMNSSSSFSMSGYSKIENCTATNNEGGGVFVTDANSNFKMMGTASISSCSAGMDGGGVSYGCGASEEYNFTMEGDASITRCSATGNGGGVYLYGNLVMNGGTISDNKASSGAGVYVRHDSSSFTMNGGTISDNKATVSGGGVYLWDPTSSFTMTNGTISNNLVNGTNNGASIKINSGNVNLPDTIPFTGDSFTENIIDGEIEVTNVTTELTNNWLASHVNSSDQWHCYSLPAGNYCVKEDITLYYPIVIEENGCNTQIYADGNYSITCQTSLPSYGTNTTMITLKSGNTLTLGGGTGKLTLDGNAVSNMTTLISVNGGSILNLKDNCTITNGNVIDGAVYVRSGCIFNMSGGTITGNSNTNTDGNCAGVKVSGGTFTMTAGTISNNWVNGINHGASIQINDGTVNLPNTPLTGGSFTANIIDGQISAVPSVITTWNDLVSAIKDLNDYTTTTEFIIMNNLTATSTIETLVPVKITATQSVTITRDSNFTGLFFETAMPLEITGTDTAIITFDGGNTSNILATYPMIYASADINLQYCTFKNNTNAGTSKDGGVLYAEGTSINSINITNCNFENNSVTGSFMVGGAIAISSTTAISNFINCNFENNIAKQQAGGAVYISGKSGNCTNKWHLFENCTFRDNKSYYDAYNYGGAIYVVSGPIILNSVVMENNIYYEGESDTEGTLSDIYLNSYQQELKLNGVIKISALKIMVNASNTKDIAISDDFDTINSKIENLVLTTGSTGSVVSVTRPFKIYTYDSIGTNINSEQETTLTENQINCFENVVDEKTGTQYILSNDGTINQQ